MPAAYIVDAVRTAGGRRGGRLAGVHPVDLAAASLDAIVARTGIDPAAVEDVIMGCVGQLLKDRKITLDLSDAAKRWLGRVGYDPVYGARPLKRAVQRYLQDPLAEKLLGGEIPDGSTVKIDEGDGALAIAVS